MSPLPRPNARLNRLSFAYRSRLQIFSTYHPATFNVRHCILRSFALYRAYSVPPCSIASMATSAGSSYYYEQLDINRQEIRLLVLHPGTLETQPVCHLETVSLLDKPPYIALSHEWGDEQERADILLHGHPHSVTGALECALRYLQCVAEPRRFWIDAICINQTNIPEKNSQVSQMLNIYVHASQTYLWIGPPDARSALGLESIRLVSSADWREWLEPVPTATRGPEMFPRIAAMHNIMSRSYWGRVWIIQEALASQRAVIKCGFDELVLKYMYGLDEYLDYARKNIPVRDSYLLGGPRAYAWEQYLYTSRTHEIFADGVPQAFLARWLTAATGSASSLIRDRIYALLGLSLPSDRKAIRPEYSEDALTDRQLFAEVMAHLMRASEPFMALGLLGLPTDGRTIDLPSWVPDWTSSARQSPVFRLSKPHFAAWMNPIAWIRLGCRPHVLGTLIDGRPCGFGFSSDHETLHLSALVVDRLAHARPIPTESQVGPLGTMDPTDRWNIWREGIIAAADAWETDVMSHPRSPYGGVPQRLDAAQQSFAFDPDNDWALPGAPTVAVPAGGSTAAAITPRAAGRGFGGPASFVRALNRDTIFTSNVFLKCQSRALAVTDKGYVGLVPSDAQAGDLICISLHCPVPFVLRDNGSALQWLGHAYVHGIMHGEAIDTAERENFKVFDIR